MGLWVFYFSGPQSCVGLGNRVLQRLRRGIKDACPAPKGGARSPPALACPRGAWTNTSGSDVGTLGREARKRRSLAEGSCPAAPGARRAGAVLRVLRAVPASRLTLPFAGQRHGRTRATSFSQACHTDPVVAGLLLRPALEGRSTSRGAAA